MTSERDQGARSIWWQWIEPLAGVLIAVIIEVANSLWFHSSAPGWVLGVGVALGSLLLALQRVAIERRVLEETQNVREELNRETKPIRALSQYVDLTQVANYEPLSDLASRYASITEIEFAPVKKQLVEEAIDKLRRLASDKRSPTLRTGDYYNWLFTQFGQLKPKDYVHAVSLSSDEEWNDSALERNFLEANIDAGRRGVDVIRIFIIPDDRITNFVKLEPINHHTVESDTPLKGYRVRQEELQKYDPKLLKAINQGFIDFNGRVGLEDKFDQEGEVRGEVTMLPQDLKRMNDIFTKLMTMAKPLSISHK